jgi:hypothetical protein
VPQLPTPKSETTGSKADWPVVVWPVTILIIVLLFAFSARLGRLLHLAPTYIRKISGPGGISLEINPEAAKEQKVYFTESFHELMTNSKYEYDQMAKFSQVREKVSQVIQVALPQILRDRATVVPHAEGIRGTVHVADIVFDRFLYQLVDYYPTPEGKGGAGRRFSQRYGIIGRAWRLGHSLGAGNALPPVAPNATPSERAEWEQKTRLQLIQQWGMFEEEAKPTSHGRPSYLCVMLRTQDGIQGLLFIDSSTENAFGSNDVASRVAKELEEHETCKILSNAVGEVMRPLRLLGPSLRVDQ